MARYDDEDPRFRFIQCLEDLREREYREDLRLRLTSDRQHNHGIHPEGDGCRELINARDALERRYDNLVEMAYERYKFDG